MDVLLLSPDAFISFLDSHKISKFHFVSIDGRLTASHPLLQPVADLLSSVSDDYDNHEAFFVQIAPKSRVLQAACVHRTNRGPAAGGVRNWLYNDMEAFFRDGLRLAKGMTHKNALAGIWWGGGKGVMARNSGLGLGTGANPTDRNMVYEEYGKFMSDLHGCYVTAEDVGTGPDDMDAIFRMTRHTTCIAPVLGGSGNPSYATAQGVMKGLEAAFKYAGKPLAGATIAVQGAGHVGIPLIHLLFAAQVKSVVASDIDEHRADDIRKEFQGKLFALEIVDKSDMSILFRDVDAVCPCATGGILNMQSIPLIKSRIICGAANNQLKNMKTDDLLLKQAGIMYIPDFLVNRMGIVNCADEHVGIIDDDPKLALHLGADWDNSIYNLTLDVLATADKENKTTQQIAVALAEERSLINNPCYGHRSIQVINWLVEQSNPDIKR